ncbi:MAG: hypothetical protein NVSMB3_06340 [Acidobacteriaceae bacterium]
MTRALDLLAIRLSGGGIALEFTLWGSGEAEFEGSTAAGERLPDGGDCARLRFREILSERRA